MAEVPKQLRPYIFKKGNKLGGRKKGLSLKEFARKYLQSMTEEERYEYLNKLDPEIVWKMSEGNPPQKNVIEGELKLPVPMMDLSKNK